MHFGVTVLKKQQQKTKTKNKNKKIKEKKFSIPNLSLNHKFKKKKRKKVYGATRIRTSILMVLRQVILPLRPPEPTASSHYFRYIYDCPILIYTFCILMTVVSLVRESKVTTRRNRSHYVFKTM